MSNTALLVIHTQVAFFQTPKPLYQADALVNNIKGLLAKARASNTPVIYIQFNESGDWEWVNTTPLHDIHPDLAPAESELVLQQRVTDVFADQTLRDELAAKNVRKLVVTGLQTEICINNSCRSGAALGYDITLESDCHSTFDGEEATAQQIIDQITAGLILIVTVKAAQEVTF